MLIDQVLRVVGKKAFMVLKFVIEGYKGEVKEVMGEAQG